MARIRSAKPESKRQPVPVDAAQYEILHNYSKITGVPIARMVREALQSHIDVVLAARMESLAKYVGGDRMAASEVPDTPIDPSPAFTLADHMADAPVLEAGPLPAAEVGLPDWAREN